MSKMNLTQKWSGPITSLAGRTGDPYQQEEIVVRKLSSRSLSSVKKTNVTRTDLKVTPYREDGKRSPAC